MSKFVLKLIKEVSINTSIYKLLINGKCQFDEFYKNNQKHAKSRNQLGQIQNILLSIGSNELNKLPAFKFKTLKRGGNDNVVDYEIRTRDYRVYLIKLNSVGKVIVFAGLKKDQKKDIKRLRKIKKEYINNK